MKAAISIPDSLNDSIQEFLRAARMSRSEFFQRAARLYLQQVSAKAVRANLDRVYGGDDTPGDVAFRRAAAAHLAELAARDER